jgi:chorismate mutase
MTRCQGVRGATTVAENTRDEMLSATRELLERIVARNEIAAGDIAAIFFTVSDDLNAEYPALAARQLGWADLALLCAREIPVPTQTVRRCIRVLLLANTERTAAQIRHVYLREAVALRPSRADVAGSSEAIADDQHNQPAGE